MKTRSGFRQFAKRQWGTIAVGLALVFPSGAAHGDIYLDMLKTRTDTFTNVTVYGRSKTDIFIRHARGIGNIKLDSLDPETIARLNSAGANGDGQDASAGASAGADTVSTAQAAGAKASAYLADVNGQLHQQLAALSVLKALSPPGPVVLAIILGGFLVVYLLMCYCLKLICLKTGNHPGFLIWLPVLQMLPLLRAASMSAWCLLGLFVPVVNLIIQIVWCFKIVQARRKSVWVAIGLLLPITNLISILYLAFSDGNDEESSATERVAVSGAPLAVEA